MWYKAVLLRGGAQMGDTALPYITPSISNKRIETIKYLNFLESLRSRRMLQSEIRHQPIDATIDLTTTCQLSCPYCAVGNGTMDRPVSLMKPDRYNSILGSLGDEVFIIWYFSTGEPLLHKQFSALISSSKHQQIFSLISTNLSLPLTDAKLIELLQSGLGVISVSLDGATGATYSQYRRGGNFDLVINNVRRLVTLKRELGLKYPLIEWRFLRFRHNQHEEDLARETAMQLGVDLIEFFPGYAPINAGPSEVQSSDAPLKGAPVSGPALENSDAARGVLDEILRDQPRAFGLPLASSPERKCDWLYFGTMIYPNGAIGPCCVATDKNDDFGNVDDFANFSAAWNAEKFVAARTMFLNGTKSETICDRCPMPGAQTYQFGQKVRSILRIAPNWALALLAAKPAEFFFDVDGQLMPQEVGAITSGAIQRKINSAASDFEEAIYSLDSAVDSTFRSRLVELAN